MGYETYPKPSAHPSKSVGEQESTDWPESSDTRYPGEGAKGTEFDGHKNKTMMLEGGSGSPNKSDYPPGRKSFECETIGGN